MKVCQIGQKQGINFAGGGRGSGNSQWRPAIHVPPQVIGKNQENFALVIGKNKKNLEILHLERVKFEKFARVIA